MKHDINNLKESWRRIKLHMWFHEYEYTMGAILMLLTTSVLVIAYG